MGFPNEETVTACAVTALLLAVAGLDFDCRRREDGFYVDPKDCNKYYRCLGHRVHPFSCGYGLHFNESIVQCDWPEQVQCEADQRGTEGSGTECPRGFSPSCYHREEGAKFRDSEDCSSFYTCLAGKHLVKDGCRHGLVYDIEKDKCDFPTNVDCGKKVRTENASCKYKVIGHALADPDDCAYYYQCSHTQNLAGSCACALGTAWDREMNTCNHLSDAKCTEYSSEASESQASGCDKTDVTHNSQETSENASETEMPACPRIVCYYTNWAQYRPGRGKFVPKDISYNLCTHIIFAFAKISNGTLLNVQWNDKSSVQPGMYEKVNKLKEKNSNLKTLLAVGGWNHSAGPFHQVSSSRVARTKFVNTTIPYLMDNGFDGLELHWEYPAHRGSPPEDKQHFSELVEDLRAGFDNFTNATQREPFLLTAAVTANSEIAGNAYEIQRISQSLDFINLMTYDFHGSWDKKTGHNSPLYPASNNTADNLTVDGAVKFYVAQGCPRNKLVVGMALYGQTFALSSGNNTAVGAPVSIAGTAGTFTRQAGFLAYYEVCGIMNSSQTQKYWDADGKVPYLVKDNLWVSYDSPESLREKVRYVRKEKLGGVMCWSLDLDDFNDQSCDNGTYPLWTAVNNECKARRSEAEQ